MHQSRSIRWRAGWLAGGAWVAFLFAAVSPAQAQIVNVQGLVGRNVDEGWTGNCQLSADWLAGNSRLFAASGAITEYWRRGPMTVLGTVSGSYGLKGSASGWQDLPFQEKIFEHLRLKLALSGPWTWEVFAQHEFDRWRRLKLRAVAGSGLRWDGRPTENVGVAMGLAVMAQAEELLKPTAVDPAGLAYEARLSSYLSGAWELSKNALMSATLYVQPKPTDVLDTRGLVDVSLQVAATPRWALKLQYALALDSRPPATVERCDTTSKASLVAAW